MIVPEVTGSQVVWLKLGIFCLVVELAWDRPVTYGVARVNHQLVSGWAGKIFTK